MAHILEKGSVTVLADKSRIEMRKSLKDPQGQVRDFFLALGSWRDESQKQLSAIINDHSSTVIKSVKDLVGEVSTLQARLSVVTDERKVLQETVDSLNCEIRNLNEKLLSKENITERGDELQDSVGQYEDQDKIRGDSGEQEVSSECGEVEDQTVGQTRDDGQTLNKEDLTLIEAPSQGVDIYDVEHEAEDEELSMESDEFHHSVPNNSKSKGTTDTEKFICPECSIAFSSPGSLEIHSKNIHSNLAFTKASRGKLGKAIKLREHSSSDETAPPQDLRRYTCDKCPYTSAHKYRMTSHVKAVHEKFKRHICEKCGFGAYEKRKLTIHMKSFHEEGDKTIKCGLCSYASLSDAKLKQHIDAVHKKTKKHFCEMCSYVTQNKYSLKMHKISVHEMGDKKYRCEKCPYASVYSTGIKRHMDGVHENIRNFICEQCDYAAAQKGTLKRHMETVH